MPIIVQLFQSWESQNVTVHQIPTSITSSVNTLDPSCFEENDGAILFVQVEGGTGEYSYSFNNSPFRMEGQREGLEAGVYPVAIQDENGCRWTGEVTLNNPPQLDVSLGDNKELNLGDSIILSPQVNDTEITLEWESEDATICLDCPNPTVKPTTSQRYNTLTGRKAPPGVYIFYAEINFRNGTTDVQTGDVTLIR